MSTVSTIIEAAEKGREVLSGVAKAHEAEVDAARAMGQGARMVNKVAATHEDWIGRTTNAIQSGAGLSELLAAPVDTVPGGIVLTEAEGVVAGLVIAGAGAVNTINKAVRGHMSEAAGEAAKAAVGGLAAALPGAGAADAVWAGGSALHGHLATSTIPVALGDKAKNAVENYFGGGHEAATSHVDALKAQKAMSGGGRGGASRGGSNNTGRSVQRDVTSNIPEA